MIKRGTAVLITFGPFAGFAGTVVSRRHQRVVVRLVLSDASPVLVELDDAMIERHRTSGRAAGQ